ncbi:MAG: hypothetical protein HW403_1432, partial [Dehalococcoidia bacterium]|nr:hypothetical protein [Dehalococcoidia bacterium]
SLGYLTADKGGGFHLKVADWQVQRENGRDDLKALMEGYSLELTLAEVKPPVVHGATGFIAVAEGEEGSYYYSRTKMVAKGKLSDHGTELGVEGFAWFDHQWGDFTLKDGGGWDWFGLQLDDGSELMVSKIRGVDGREVVLYGTHVDSKGVSTHLAAEDIRVKATGSWRSPSSGAEYPMGWTLAVPRLALELELQPVVQNQEMDTTASTGIIYWEGEVKVVGRRGSAAVGGLGYVELTGYAAKAN